MSAYDNPKMRDEIWIRVYAEHFHAVSPTHNPSTAARLAAQVADDAVAFLPKPMHHEDADGFKATAFRSFKLHALHDLGPVKAGQPVLVVHMDRGMVDCIPWPEGMFRIPANELAEQPPEKHKTKVPRTKDADRWLGDTFIAAEARDPLNKLAGTELLVDPVVLEGRRARVEPIPASLELRLVVDKMFEAAERAGLITGTEHDGFDDDTLAEMIARRIGQRRSNLDEVYEAHGERFTLPADVVAELKGAAPLLLERADAEAVVALRAAAGTNARVRELEAGIRRALDHLGSAREEDSLDRRELHFGSKHTCAPRWRVWVHDYHEVGDDADSWEVHARDAESAAEVALATHNDEGQYVERETLVFVRRLDTGEQRWIRVYGEPSIHWNTGEVDPPEGLEAKAPTSDGSDDEDEGDEEAEAC